VQPAAALGRWLLRHEAVQLGDALAQEGLDHVALGCDEESPGGGEDVAEARR
jgi:hypothetical protein